MDCTTNRFDAETLVSSSVKPSARRRKRAGVKAVARATEADQARRVEFETLAISIRDDLKPQGALESLYVDRIATAAWRLREAVSAERAGVLDGSTIGVDSDDLLGRMTDNLHRATDRAERALRRSLDTLKSLRGTGLRRWGRATFPAFTADASVGADGEGVEQFGSNEWTIVPAEFSEPDATEDAPFPRWQDRLIFDLNVSDVSPVVKGTWITVGQIVSLIVDGSTWADILRSHPELTEDDIRICLSYATEQENDGEPRYHRA